MSYVVLARKYRPQTFSEVYSQEHITKILSNAINSKRIAHAYLFTGPRGVGKTSLARILAKSLNCVNGPTDSPCGVCHNCREITASTSPDVIEIDGASNTGVDDVRELQKELFYAPSQSDYKIYIIDEVHMLSKNAFNALLKTLEEPPDNVAFIFATTEPVKVPPTIVSRCQRYDFRRIPVEDIAANLKEISHKEEINIDNESIYLIARKSDGGMRDALSLLDQVISSAEGQISIEHVREIFSELPVVVYSSIMRDILTHDTSSLILNYHKIVNQGIDLIEFLNSFLEYMRQLLLLKVGISPKGLIDDDLLVLKSLADAFTTNTLLYMTTLLVQLKQDIRLSSHPSIMVEVVLIKMTKLEEIEDLESILKMLNNIQTPSESLEQSKKMAAETIETPPVKPVVKKPEPETVIEYVSPPKVKELTKEHVCGNWDSFLDRIKPIKSVLAVYLNEGTITNVTGDIIFMDFASQIQYKMVSEAREEVSDLLGKFFDLPVKLIIRLNETVQKEIKRSPTLQDIQKTNPVLAKLIEMTDALIIPEGDIKSK